MALLVLYVLLALGVSFLCSVMEAVLLSVTPSFVAALEKKGHRAGPRLRVLKDDIDRPLSAILSLNTIAHTVGAAGAGAQAAVVFGDPYVALASAVLTLLILIVSEIIPKTLGALYWRELSATVVRLLRPTIWIMWPLVKLSQGLTRMLSHGRPEASVSREEFTALAELGQQQGVIEEQESRILKSLLQFNSLRVDDVMTPRTVVFALPEDTPAEELLSRQEGLRFSRIPLYTVDRDNVTGYVLKDDVLLRISRQQDSFSLSALKREVVVVPEGLPLTELFERLLNSREHIALVVDEYGGMAGIATMEDVIETLLGMEIVDEADSVQDMQELARQQWLRRAQRLGLIEDKAQDDEQPVEGRRERASAARFGITGGQAPSAEQDP